MEELEAQLLDVRDELKTEKALGKINQEAAADEVARAREEIKVRVRARRAGAGDEVTRCAARVGQQRCRAAAADGDESGRRRRRRQGSKRAFADDGGGGFETTGEIV